MVTHGALEAISGLTLTDANYQGFIQRGGNWDFPPQGQVFPPQEFENYYRKISTMMINTNYVSFQEQSLQTDMPIIFSKYVENFIEVKNAKC